MPATYINDQWVQQDQLGLGRAGDELARMSLEVNPPFTIGITGKWGCGKTSVMRRAFATLGGKPISQGLRLGQDKIELNETTLSELNSLRHRFENGRRNFALDWTTDLHNVADQSLSIWYSPWQHQESANPLIPLLQEIRAQYQVKRRILENGRQLNRQGGLAALTLIEHVIDAAISFTSGKPIKAAVGVSENVRKAWNENNPENLAKPSDGQRFHLLFEDAIENLLDDLNGSSRKKLSYEARLIVFIDDLDRCEEKAVVALLEAIKLYLGTSRCVFILGVDDVAVGDALKRHWQGRSDDNNREYLEKLFQATLPVPQPQPKQVRALILQQLESHGFPADAREALANDIEALLEPNPRKVKNFLNSLCINWQMLRCKAMKEAENCRRLVMFQYLRVNHRPVWRLLEREPVLLQLLLRVFTDSTDPLNIDSKSLSTDELRLTREIFSRSFAHVLKHDDGKDMKLHRSQSLDAAVDKALERLDRRRSDQYFVEWMKQNVSPNESLPAMYLQITDTD